jgi:hypothetical protein
MQRNLLVMLHEEGIAPTRFDKALDLGQAIGGWIFLGGLLLGVGSLIAVVYLS